MLIFVVCFVVLDIRLDDMVEIFIYIFNQDLYLDNLPGLELKQLLD